MTLVGQVATVVQVSVHGGTRLIQIDNAIQCYVQFTLNYYGI